MQCPLHRKIQLRWSDFTLLYFRKTLQPLRHAVWFHDRNQFCPVHMIRVFHFSIWTVGVSRLNFVIHKKILIRWTKYYKENLRSKSFCLYHWTLYKYMRNCNFLQYKVSNMHKFCLFSIWCILHLILDKTIQEKYGLPVQRRIPHIYIVCQILPPECASSTQQYLKLKRLFLSTKQWVNGEPVMTVLFCSPFLFRRHTCMLFPSESN